MSLWDGETNLFMRDPDDDPRGLGLSEVAYQFIAGLKEHAKAYIALTAPDRLLLQAAGDRGADERRHLGARLRHLRLEQPDDDAAHPRARGGSRTEPSTAPATRISRRRRSSPPASTGSSAGSIPGDPTTANMYETSVAERREMGIETLPANLLDATRELEGDEVLRKALGSVGDEDYVDYFIRCKRREWQTAHEQITQWELDRYLQLF